MHHSVHVLNSWYQKIQGHVMRNYAHKSNIEQIEWLTPLRQEGMTIDVVCSNSSAGLGGLEWLKVFDSNCQSHL